MSSSSDLNTSKLRFNDRIIDNGIGKDHWPINDF
jgi:hypothetical protein